MTCPFELFSRGVVFWPWERFHNVSEAILPVVVEFAARVIDHPAWGRNWVVNFKVYSYINYAALWGA